MIEYTDKYLGKVRVLNVTEARASFAAVLSDHGYNYIITKNNKPLRVLIDYEDLEQLTTHNQKAGLPPPTPPPISLTPDQTKALLKRDEEIVPAEPPTPAHEPAHLKYPTSRVKGLLEQSTRDVLAPKVKKRGRRSSGEAAVPAPTFLQARSQIMTDDTSQLLSETRDILTEPPEKPFADPEIPILSPDDVHNQTYPSHFDTPDIDVMTPAQQIAEALQEPDEGMQDEQYEDVLQDDAGQVTEQGADYFSSSDDDILLPQPNALDDEGADRPHTPEQAPHHKTHGRPWAPDFAVSDDALYPQDPFSQAALEGPAETTSAPVGDDDYGITQGDKNTGTRPDGPVVTAGAAAKEEEEDLSEEQKEYFRKYKKLYQSAGEVQDDDSYLAALVDKHIIEPASLTDREGSLNTKAEYPGAEEAHTAETTAENDLEAEIFNLDFLEDAVVAQAQTDAEAQHEANAVARKGPMPSLRKTAPAGAGLPSLKDLLKELDGEHLSGEEEAESASLDDNEIEDLINRITQD
ncbi:MAG: type II toxin-antitoxin system Phd/YefM family antitoxin [Deltaproteobacteria bacterium]|nr:type II toxin-antitoxin system Phd/YefM family antitoxin [Deltaproteobacteria bacterium]